MKTLRFVLLTIMASAPALAVAAADEQKAPAPKSAAQESFDRLKTLAGSWVGTLTTSPPEPAVAGKLAQFSLRVTSRGNAFVHELSLAGIPDHPVTVFYVEGDRLLLTHYCDAGNRPRMAGKASPDGRSVEFDFLDLGGGNQKGHMHQAKFTFVDPDHHSEDWTWMAPNGQPLQAHFELQRTNFGSGLADH